MPAGQDDNYTWYYVFILDEEANACWTIGDNTRDKLQDMEFTGDDYQKFAVIDKDGSNYHIINKGSGYYLYRSKKKMDAHQPIRQEESPDSDRYKFSFKQLNEVTIPTIPDTPGTDPGELDNPPAPEGYGDIPAFPHSGDAYIPVCGGIIKVSNKPLES